MDYFSLCLFLYTAIQYLYTFFFFQFFFFFFRFLALRLQNAPWSSPYNASKHILCCVTYDSFVFICCFIQHEKNEKKKKNISFNSFGTHIAVWCGYAIAVMQQEASHSTLLCVSLAQTQIDAKMWFMKHETAAIHHSKVSQRQTIAPKKKTKLIVYMLFSSYTQTIHHEECAIEIRLKLWSNASEFSASRVK